VQYLDKTPLEDDAGGKTQGGSGDAAGKIAESKSGGNEKK
jgi:hypothetical protein